MYLIRNKCTTVPSRGMKILLKIGIVLHRCFRRIFYFVFGNACFICICFKTAIWRFPALFEIRSGSFGEDRLATLFRYEKKNSQQASHA